MTQSSKSACEGSQVLKMPGKQIPCFALISNRVWDPILILGVLVYLVLVTRFLLFEDREAALPLEAFIQGLVTRLERYLQCRYFTYDLLTTDELTK